MPAPAPPVAVPFAEVASALTAAGFAASACLPPPAALDPAGFDRMLADGIGAMTWLAESREKRLDPRFLLPGAKAMIVAAIPHQDQARCGDLRRARYAAGKDYHHVARRALGRIAAGLNARYATPWHHRACVDSAPINERTLARLAGLGWIGRNALLISPDLGSWLLLGVLLTEAPVAAQPGPHGADRCGRCTACESACPTRALVGRRCLTERCISYLTIEHDGVIPAELARLFQGWWFGCDRCQEVCPWNRKAPGPGDGRLAGDERDAEILALRCTDFDTHFAARAIRRLGYQRFRRNLVVACASLGRELPPADDEGDVVRAQRAELRAGV